MFAELRQRERKFEMKCAPQYAFFEEKNTKHAFLIKIAITCK